MTSLILTLIEIARKFLFLFFSAVAIWQQKHQERTDIVTWSIRFRFPSLSNLLEPASIKIDKRKKLQNSRDLSKEISVRLEIAYVSFLAWKKCCYLIEIKNIIDIGIYSFHLIWMTLFPIEFLRRIFYFYYIKLYFVILPDEVNLIYCKKIRSEERCQTW